MLGLHFFLLSILYSNVICQIIPHRFDQVIQKINQYKNILIDDQINYDDYNVNPKKLLQTIPFLTVNNSTHQCINDFEVILQSATNRNLWALKVLDSWGKPLPSGILKGNLLWLGNYDECIKSFYYPANKSFLVQPFSTQHCTILPKSSQSGGSPSPSIVLGICVPSSCDQEGVISLVHTIFKKINITADGLACSNDPTNGQKHLTNGAIATIAILSILATIVLIGTILDLYLTMKQDVINPRSSNINGHASSVEERFSKAANNIELVPKTRIALESPTIKFIAEFSALKTLRYIFTMKQKNNNESFEFVNGIRVLSLFVVILGHSIVFSLSASSNISDVLVWTHYLPFQLIINAVLSVDTFFVLSGFLTSILFMREVEKKGKLSIRIMLLYYIHRYIRLTPTFLLMILVNINLSPYFGYGPLFPTQQGFEVPQCRSEYWWTSIVYIANLVKPDYMCLPIAWYLHNDMQFHWIAPLSLVPFAIGHRKISVFIAILFTILGIGSILTILLYYPNMSLNALTAFGDTVGPSFFEKIYIVPWCRISAYSVGLLAGYCVIYTGRQYRMNKYVKSFGTILAILLGFVCLFATYPDYILVNGLSRSILVAYETLSRTVWSASIGWLLFLCSTNQGGIVNQILSWPIWSPLTKLNYSCYLVHATIINIIVLNQMMPIYYQGHVVVNNFVVETFFSYVTAILLVIFFERPFFLIEKTIFKR